MEDTKKPKTTIEYAEWPRDAPSALERKVLSIICGNSRLHWALHEGSVNKFIPILFWHTAHVDEIEGAYEDEEPCDLLEAHIASQAHALIFGDSENRGFIHNVSETAAKRDAPGISVFVVSSNPAMEEKICYMFRDVPAKIFKLRNTDFFTAEQGVYPTMGVDRVAALYGAKLHYGCPALVIDGGTAMTYSAVDYDGRIIGGGISPGVKVRLQSLADYTGALPNIDHKKFKALVEGNIAAKTPFPLFAKDTETAMISPICGELACQLRSIVRQFVSRCQSNQPTSLTSSNEGEVTEKEPTEQNNCKEGEVKEKESPEQKKLPIIFTGGDAKFLYDLLKTDASGIVSMEPSEAPTPTNIYTKIVRNLVTYAIGNIVHEKFLQKPMTPQEKLKLKIQGLRIAAPAIDPDDVFTRGCVFNITPASIIEGYAFHARFDNGMQKDLTLTELYDYLVLYNEIGEEGMWSGSVGSVDEDWVTEKKTWSSKVQEELCNVSRPIRSRTRELKPHIERGEVHKLFRKRSIGWKQSRSNKRVKRDVRKLQKPIGKRIAKMFPIESADGQDPADTIFFGTVKHVSDPHLEWYFIQYDDGDVEEIDLNEVMNGIALYKEHKGNDGKADSTAGGSATSSATTTKLVSQKVTVTKETNTFTDMSLLLSASSPAFGNEDTRRISEHKEDID